MQKKLIKVDPTDNVAVALVNLVAGETIAFEGEDVVVLSDTKMKHKIAMKDFESGDKIIMYGVIVGKASQKIAKGDVITTANVKHESAKVTGKTDTIGWEVPNVDQWKDKTFMGYHRSDGQVGTENVWLFFPLVFCENRNIEILKGIFEKELKKPKENDYQLLLRSLVNSETGADDAVTKSTEVDLFENIDVKFIQHQGGCGGIRQDSHSLAKLLAGYVNNPNVAGATVLSLGCQNLQISIFQDAMKAINPNSDKPVLIYDQQSIGTIEEMLSTVVKDSFAAIKEANKIVRKPAPLSKLTIGLECGGSDGFSGISANPTLGVLSDKLVALGGTTILSEFPELCGVEQELVNGLITDAMKSAGASKKGGTSPIVGVYDYGEYINEPGFTLLCTPGNDVECTTAMVGSGANMVLFTTGLGTPTGNPIAPVVKVSSNTQLANKMSDIIDFNTGEIITGEKSIEETADEMLEYIIKVASGEIKTKAAILNQNDFIPWKRGVSL